MTPKRQAALDLAEKLRLEESVKGSLKKLFLNIARDFEKSYLTDERIVDVDNYNIDLQAILKDHYRKVAKWFSWNLRDTEKSARDKKIAALIDSQLTTFINQQTGYQSNLIITSLATELGSTVNDVIIEGAAAGVNLTNAQVAARAKQKFKGKIDGRVTLIAATETQIMSEKSKFVEAVNISAETNTKVRKQWVSVLDEVTRVAHIFADGQIQDMDTPFIVGGEQMMTPGDSSLGASAGNIINCRCSAEYIKE